MLKSLFGKKDPTLRDKRGKYGLGILIVCIIYGLIPQLTDSKYYVNLVAFMMVFGIMAVGLDIVAGYLGLGTLGHAGFMGATAYCAGILSARVGWGFIAVLLASLLFALVLSVMFAFLTTKLNGITFLMVNLALGQCVWGLAYRWSSLTGGDNGLGGIPRPEVFGYRFGTAEKFYYFLFFFFVLVVFFLYRLINSPYGLTLHGIRNSPKRMRALGFDVYKHRFIAYILSGTIAGLSGVMLAYYNQYLGPNVAHITTSSKAYLMVLMGGAGTLLGPIFGSALVVFLENFISTMTERWVMILGGLYVLCVMFTPRGIIGLAETINHKIKSRKFKRQALDCVLTPEDSAKGASEQ